MNVATFQGIMLHYLETQSSFVEDYPAVITALQRHDYFDIKLSYRLIVLRYLRDQVGLMLTYRTGSMSTMVPSYAPIRT